MRPYVDIHTHQAAEPLAESLVVRSLRHSEIRLTHQYPERYFSAGMHPWDYQADRAVEDFDEVARAAQLPNVLAIGECGLDRQVGPELSIQAGIFEQHLSLAEHLNKPVVIHCVRAFPELLALTKQRRPRVPMLVHGFNNKPQILQQLIRNQFLVSFGQALLWPESNASRGIGQVPLAQLFLETDDSQTPISAIFAAASERLQLPEATLREQIHQNFVRYFYHSTKHG